MSLWCRAEVIPRNKDGKPNPQLSTHQLLFAGFSGSSPRKAFVAFGETSQDLMWPFFLVRTISTGASQSQHLAGIDRNCLAQCDCQLLMLPFALQQQALAHAKRLILEGAALVKQAGAYRGWLWNCCV